MGLVVVSLSLFTTVSTEVHALTAIHPSQGNYQGFMRGWFRFHTGSGSSAENSANYHVCTDPAYSQSNFTEVDGTLGGETGTPAWVAGSATDMPGLDFTSANKHYVKLLDNSTSCTTGNDPWDADIGVADTFALHAWVKPEVTLTCVGTPAGTKYTIASKWDDSSQCSYKLYLEVVDSNGGSCDADSDLKLAARALFNDSGGTFSCGSPCEVRQPQSTFDLDDNNNGWTHIQLMVNPESSNADAYIMVDGKRTETNANGRKCEDLTDIPENVGLQNSTQDLLIGIDTVGGNEAFEGKIAEVMVAVGTDIPIDEHQNRLFMYTHLNDDIGATGLFGADSFVPQYFKRKPTGTPPTFDAAQARYGSSLNLDGTEDYAESITGIAKDTGVTAGTKNYVVEAWIRPVDADGGGTKEQTIVSRWLYDDSAGCPDDTTESSFRLFLDTSGKLNFELMADDTTKFSVTGTTVLSDNKWYHVAGVVTNAVVGYLTTQKVYVHVNGVEDTGGSPTSKPGATNFVYEDAPIYLGATRVTSPGTTCASGTETDFFEGHIDEVMVQVYRQSIARREYFNPGVVINEVNFQKTNEEVELYVWSGVNGAINLHNNGIALCSSATSKQIIFDDSCGAQCSSKSVDAGDIVTVVFDTTSPPADTSCSGAATTCTWYSGNSSATTDLAAGDIVDAGDGVSLYGNLISSPSERKLRAAVIDSVVWGGATGCQINNANQGRGIWQWEESLSTGLITDSTKSLCLKEDGRNEDGVFSWTQCNDSIGSLNSTASSAVELRYLEATQTSDGVQVAWGTGTEIDTLGFHVECADSKSGPFVRKTSQIILAKGASADYLFHDESPGSCQYYRLVEIENSSLETPTEAVAVATPSTAITSLDADATVASGDSPSTVGSENGAADLSPQPTGLGCGHIVTSEPLASLALILLCLLTLFLSTRTHLIGRDP